MDINRVILIVLDSVGIGELPDADEYGDVGSNTVGNIVKAFNGIKIPNLCKLGMGKIDGIDYLPVPDDIQGSYGRMAEASKGKDTTTGHWEISGVKLAQEFPTYPQGFPPEVIDQFKNKIGTDILANYPASGTEIIKDLGEKHMQTGYPIVYTSADSVFQIAAHEDIIPIDRLYEMCRIARDILQGPHAVGRVIARPFTGNAGSFTRTKNRRDFSLEPTGVTILDKLKEAGYDVMAVGKIEDIFAGKGITYAVHTSDNMDGMDQTLRLIKEDNKGMIFTNLVDFDMVYGHRNNAQGYKEALEAVDQRLPEIMSAMKDTDVLMITADHGCDPTTESTDHSREYVPVLLYGKYIKADISIGTRKTFSDMAATIADIFSIHDGFNAESFLNQLRR
ncbi:phosphopentomutase [Petroclostridium sp. X23]|nr:phosphopentomutase [Petroclostridium sp. X23]WHH57033.1 phosphopentomutase [Petroclostridium sp. X23]